MSKVEVKLTSIINRKYDKDQIDATNRLSVRFKHYLKRIKY